MPEPQAPRQSLIPYPLDALPPGLQQGVVAIGNFDGVHRGHVALLEAATTRAAELGLPAVVLTFEPHPRSFFRPQAPVFRLSDVSAKARLFAVLGITGLAVATFDRAFADLSPDAFVETILVGRLKARAAVVGADFRYGHARAGTAGSLVEFGSRIGLAVSAVGEVTDATGMPVSSSAIRRALEEGRAGLASELLGHRWFVVGTVIPGEKRGRELGFPTANIRLPDDCRLRHGIYAVTVAFNGRLHGGVASFGRRPTFDNGAPLLEVFVFDFSGDLYGRDLTVAFLEWIRPEERFASVADLIRTIASDADTARSIIAAAGEGSRLDRTLAALS